MVALGQWGYFLPAEVNIALGQGLILQAGIVPTSSQGQPRPFNAMLTGNSADDAYALSAGTGQKLPASGGSGAALPTPGIGSRILAVGHSYLQGGGVTHVDRQFITLLSGLMRSDLRDLGVGGSLAAYDQSWLPTSASGGTLGWGGWAWVLQNVVPYYTAGAPYTPGLPQLPFICIGFNDIAQHSADSGNPVNIFKEALRAHVSRMCVAKLFEESDASIALGGATWQPVKLDTNKNSGSGYQPIPANGATITITLPADFEGGTVALGLTVWPSSDGQLAFTGTASQVPATKTLSGLAYAAGGTGSKRNSSNGIVLRVPGLLASDAGKTIVATYSGGAGTQFSTPAAPGAITSVGTAGSTTYTYERVYRTYNGDTIPSATTSTATGNATLSTTNYNQIPAGSAWPSGVEAELIIRTVGGTPGIIATLTGGPAIVNDQANAAPGGAYTASSVNPLTGGAALDYWQIESNNPATKVALCNIATPPAATLTSLGLTAATFATYNAALSALAAEFADVAGQVLVINIDSALGNTGSGGTASLYAGTGNVHPNNRGHAILADTCRSVIQAWAVSFASTDIAHQSRVAKRITGRTLVRSPTSGTLWNGGTGSYTLGTTWADIDATNLALAIDAEVGDDLEVVLSGMWYLQATNGCLDVCTTTAGGAVINYFSTATSSPSNLGQSCWYSTSGVISALYGSAVYTVTQADLITLNTVPGVVLVKLRGFSSAPKTLYAGAQTLPLTMHLKNLGPRNTPGFNAS
jgi:lysophospholipase L1-like esterase